jgi:hypothetical protein
MLNTFIPDINYKRKKLKNENQRALLILDGHSTRQQVEIWEEMKKQNIDAVIIPSHSSNLTQPLDQTVNGNFKRLLEKIPSLPKKKKEIEENLPQFIANVNDCAQACLSPRCVREGFEKALVVTKDNKIGTLKEKTDEYLKQLPEKNQTKLTVY